MPLSKQNFEALCYACRTGDAENADRLISTGVNINQVDKFDNSPLFLASLCGHENVVRLLLERGAICDRDRHEGARCIYGALTDSIRDILLSYDISKAFDTNQPFATHISSLLNDDELQTSDMQVTCGEGIGHNVHKFMLSARSPTLASMISQPESDKDNILQIECPSDTLSIFLKFLYLMPILHEMKPADFASLIKLADSFNLNLLREFLDKARHMTDPVEKSSLMISYQYKFTELARKQLKDFVHDHIINGYLETGSESVVPITSTSSTTDIKSFPDMYLKVNDPQGSTRVYPCHMAMLSRADFFKHMLFNDMKEGEEYLNRENKTQSEPRDNIPLCISLPSCSHEVGEIIINYLYFDSTDIPSSLAIDVLRVADYILADRLKNLCAAVITQSAHLLDTNSIFDILQLAWDTGVERLEQFSAKYIAENIRSFDSYSRLETAIKDSSKRISERQQTDTIELVADIRFYILQKYDLDPDDLSLLESEADDLEFLRSIGLLDYKTDMSIIESLLERLNLII